MLFLTSTDFFVKAKQMKTLSRQEEKELYLKMKEGDMDARDCIVQSYVKVIASKIKRLSSDMYSLDLIYNCIDELEKAVDNFDFLQDSQSFMNRLDLLFNKKLTENIAKR